MADIGVLPSKTAISITSTTGEKGTIPAATRSAAGCMSAEQARQLELLYGLHETGGGVVVIEPPARTDAVTRSELRQVLTTLQRTMPPPTALLPVGTDYESRLADLERREMDTALRMEQLLQAFEAFCTIVETKMVDIDGRLADLDQTTRFIETNALGGVEVRAVA